MEQQIELQIVTATAVIFVTPPIAAPENAVSHQSRGFYSYSSYDDIATAQTDWNTIRADFDPTTFAGLQTDVKIREQRPDPVSAWNFDRIEAPGEYIVYWKNGAEHTV